MTALEPRQTTEAIRPLERMPAIIELGRRAVSAMGRVFEEPAGTDHATRAMVISSHDRAQVYSRAVWNSREKAGEKQLKLDKKRTS